MAKEKNITVIMSLHEIDLAQKVADKIICVKGETIFHYGTPEEVFKEELIRDLYEIENGVYDPRFGSIELPRPEGKPDILVLSGGGSGISLFRKLQRENIPFIAGILYTNDLEYPLAKQLAAEVISEKPFCRIGEETLEKAKKAVKNCSRVIACQIPIGEMNKKISELFELAKELGKLEEQE